MTRRVDAAIVGGGPAGAAVATWLARAGHEVVVIERTASWRWHACGVFSSPASLDELRLLGLPTDVLESVARRIPAMRVESPAGAMFRLTYGDDGSGKASPVGFDRGRLDPAMLELARASGAEVWQEAVVECVSVGASRAPVAGDSVRSVAFRGAAGAGTIEAAVVVGADGIRSRVAHDMGVTRRPLLPPRVGLTYHLAEVAPDGPARIHGAAGDRRDDARMVIFRGGYCGVAPVPGGRLNIGIVIGAPRIRRELARTGADALAERIVAGLPSRDELPWALDPGRRTDRIVGASPIGHRVSRMAGDGWLLVGDAAGFLDPFTGEGIHRALVSARLAAEAIDRTLRGHAGALAGYERTMRDRFGSKDILGWLVQLFLGRPWLFDHAARRLARRDNLRETMSLVMADLVPASRALNARYLAALLAP